MEFTPFTKIPRLNREMIVTEKIDGTNAQIEIVCEPDAAPIIYTGSRTRYITPDDDNAGFARWAKDHADELLHLGPGRHFGEWWGSGIQRGYGLTKGDKRFSLFNTTRWTPDVLPSCCSVVPVLYQGIFSSSEVQRCINTLRSQGSKAAPGFMNPEGVVIYHVQGNLMFKATLEKDEEYKGKQRAVQVLQNKG